MERVRTATWMRVDPEVGARVDSGTIVGSLLLAGALAVVVGTGVAFTINDFDRVFSLLVFGFMISLAWGLVFLCLGYLVTRFALRRGWFGPVPCVVFGIAVVWPIGLVALVAQLGSPSDPEILLYSIDLGVIYGSLSGFIFWLILTYREPRLVPGGWGSSRALSAMIIAMLLLAYVSAARLYIQS